MHIHTLTPNGAIDLYMLLNCELDIVMSSVCKEERLSERSLLRPLQSD
jgi:hypothetical protein